MILHLAVLQHEPETGLGSLAPMLDEADAETHVFQTTRGQLPDAARFDGALVLGGSLDAHDVRLLETRRWIRTAVREGTPVLGICLGAQLLAQALGARVRRGRPEAGLHDLHLTDAAALDPLFAALPRRFEVFGFHQDHLDLPPDSLPLAGSIASAFQAFRHGAATYGLQFHPEVRADDVLRWRGVPAYVDLATRAGVDLDRLALELDRAAPELDLVAGHLLERWLQLVVAVAALDLRLHPVV